MGSGCPGIRDVTACSGRSSVTSGGIRSAGAMSREPGFTVHVAQGFTNPLGSARKFPLLPEPGSPAPFMT